VELDRERGVSNFAVAASESLSAAREVVLVGRWDELALSAAPSINLEKGTKFKGGRKWSEEGG
jgi:hypothetical protein